MSGIRRAADLNADEFERAMAEARHAPITISGPDRDFLRTALGDLTAYLLTEKAHSEGRRRVIRDLLKDLERAQHIIERN